MIYLLPLLSIVLGYGLAISLKPIDKKRLKLLLAYSGSFLLSFTVLQLLPEIYHHTDEHGGDSIAGSSVGIYIMVGIFIQIILEFFSKGAEHGHVHLNKEHLLHKVPWPLFISLCIHALLEGMPISHYNDMVWGIAVHHFPIALILTAFFIDSGLRKSTIFCLLITFAVITPLGTVLSKELEFINDHFTEISAIVVGILFHISSTIIYESNEAHKFNVAKLLAITLGIVTAFILKH